LTKNRNGNYSEQLPSTICSTDYLDEDLQYLNTNAEANIQPARTDLVLSTIRMGVVSRYLWRVTTYTLRYSLKCDTYFTTKMSATTDITTNSKYVMKSVCVFCGSKTGNRPEYVEGTKALAKEMLKRQIGLVYGGGNIGLMGVVSSSIVEGT
jgi:hypothetical protein